MKATLLILIIVCLSSCYTSQKAEQQVYKANDKYPEVVAKLARDKYPCTDLLKPDTTTIYQDSIVYIDCPETPPNTFEVVRIDTVNNVITRTVRVPVHMPVQIRTVTNWYEDSSKLFLSTQALNKATVANTKLSDNNDKLSKKVARKSKENWIWRIIALVLTGWTVFRFWNKLTTIKMRSV